MCQEELYLKELVRYIHLNPILAGLVPDLAGLQLYHYCGHAALLGDAEVKWQETEYILTLFGTRVKSARRAYSAYMEEGLRQGRRPDLVGGGLVRSLGGWSEIKRMEGCSTMSDERILGESGFVDRILSEAGEALERRYELKALGYDLQRVAERAAAVFGMEVAEIFSPGRQDSKVKARSLVCLGRPGTGQVLVRSGARLCHEHSRHQLRRDPGREPCPEQKPNTKD